MSRYLKSPEQVKSLPDRSFLHWIVAAGCYVLALVLAVMALLVMWGLLFYPSEFFGKILIAVITGIVGVIFLWALLIKKWSFLD
jgi:hypothetical protein